MKHLDIVNHYEKCFIKHGDTHLGVDWPDAEDARLRYGIMLDGINAVGARSCLDFGSGLAHFYDFLIERVSEKFDYEGLELSKKMFAFCAQKHPKLRFYSHDVLTEGWKMKQYDAVVMNGVFTEKLGLQYNDMFNYMSQVLRLVYQNTNKVVVFNLMSKQVDWERDDLFHVSLDKIAKLLCDQFGRNFVIRNDYGLYDYTIYLYK